MNINLEPQIPFSLKNISSTRLWVIVFGILDGFGGVVHGLHEALRGNTPTSGFYLENFGAFSVIPNYLVTGTAVIVVALFITVWTTGFVQKKNGPTLLLITTILFFFIGGGVAQFFFGLIAWGVAQQISQSLTRWERIFSPNTRKRLAKIWPYSFVIGYLFLASGIGIWLILLPPGTNHGDVPVTNYLCWSLLAVGLILQLLTITAGFARDIEKAETTRDLPR